MQGLIRWLSRRSLRTLHGLGALAGWLTWLLSPSYRRRLAENAALAGVSPSERRRAVAEAGRMVLELPRLWLRPAGTPIQDPVRWEGAELIDEGLAAATGLVILTPHLGSFEMAAQAFAERYGAAHALTVMYRPARQPWLREFEEGARARPGIATAPANLAGVRQMIRALRRGETTGLLPDQVPPDGQGVWAPFFGRPAYTITLAARLAQQTGAGLLVLWCERLAHGAGYVVRVSRLAEPPPTAAADDEALQLAAAGAINRSMEALILQCPGQYLWGYHRYKRPRATL